MSKIREFESKLAAINDCVDEIGSSIGCVSLALSDEEKNEKSISTNKNLLEKIGAVKVECQNLIEACSLVENSVENDNKN